MLFTGHLASIRTVLTCILPAIQQFGAITSTLQTTSCPNGTGRGGGNPPQHPQRRETARALAAPPVPQRFPRGGSPRPSGVGGAARKSLWTGRRGSSCSTASGIHA